MRVRLAALVPVSLIAVVTLHQTRSQQRIVGTADGGRTWQVDWAGPWSEWT